MHLTRATVDKYTSLPSAVLRFLPPPDEPVEAGGALGRHDEGDRGRVSPYDVQREQCELRSAQIVGWAPYMLIKSPRNGEAANYGGLQKWEAPAGVGGRGPGLPSSGRRRHHPGRASYG
jgi:hypothetical protein